MSTVTLHRYKNFLGTQWTQELLPFFQSSEYEVIRGVLAKDKQKGYKLAPYAENIFRAFLECPLEHMHTIVLGQDPYSSILPGGEYCADGLAFSSRHSTRAPKALENLLDAIDINLFNGYNTELTNSFDLTRWANQGMLLLNAALTTVVGRPGHHVDVWKPFTEFVLGRINALKDNCAVLLIGREAQTYKSLFTNPTFIVLQAEHPILGDKTGRRWICGDMFNKLNEFYQQNNIKFNW